MDDSFEIEIIEEKELQEEPAQLPLNILSFGEIQNDDVKVYIKQDVYKALEKYALADTDHERGTILLGDYYEELGKTHVVISNYIEARYTDASASTLTFTHETWDYVHREQDAKYPDKKIVGWQHTHPSYGIFLSNYDLFIHENFFNLPFQVAYVIDPIQSLRGFFQWKNGKIEKLSGFYVYDDVGKAIKIEQAKKSAPEESAKSKSGWLAKVAVALALLLAVGSLIAWIQMRKTIRQQSETIEAQAARQLQLEQALEERSRKMDGLRGGESGDKEQPDDLLGMLESQQSQIDDQQKTIEELQKTVAALTGQSSVEKEEEIRYTVQAHDTLGRICADLGIDYWKNRDKILELNEIENENMIHVGQILKFPAYMKEQ